MDRTEWTWKTQDGVEMFAKSWIPSGKARAAIALTHGLGEHIGRYEGLGGSLTGAGYALLGYDLRGHGRSGGARGHTPSYEALMEDIHRFLSQVEERFPGLPCFLYGHSLGGNLVLNYALRLKPELKGVIATSPWLRLAFDPAPSKITLGKWMNGIAPGFSQSSGLNTRGLSHDETVVSAYEQDALVHDRISARLFVSTIESGRWALQHASEFPLPLLLMHGSEDPITSAEGSREFAEKAGEKVTLKLWPGMYHEIHNEPGKAEVYQTILDWLGAHLLP